MVSLRLLVVAGVAIVGSCTSASAQDTREVKEPLIPASCAVLPAKLQSVGDKVAAADEGKLDTARIQAALDGCKPGMAVELKGAGEGNAFLSGPLELRSGVTLLIDEGVTLFGSRDPKVYEMRGPDSKADDPVKCGTSVARPGQFGVQAAGAAAAVAGLRRGGCRPLISASNVTDADITLAGLTRTNIDLSEGKSVKVEALAGSRKTFSGGCEGKFVPMQ